MKRNFFCLTLILFLFTGCASVQNIYTFSSPAAQTYFIRPTKIKKVPKCIKSCEFDITIRTDSYNQLIEDPTFNYSFICNENSYNKIENTKISFLCDDIIIAPIDSQKIYKEIDENRNLTLRCTSTLKKEDFIQMMDCSTIKIIIENDNDIVEQIDKTFTQKINEIGVLIR